MGQSIIERAIDAEIDTKKRMKAVGNLSWFISLDINRNIPTTWRWAREDFYDDKC